MHHGYHWSGVWCAQDQYDTEAAGAAVAIRLRRDFRFGKPLLECLSNRFRINLDALDVDAFAYTNTPLHRLGRRLPMQCQESN